MRKISRVSSSPESYYAGRRRWAGALPDNILLFSRTHRRKPDYSDHMSACFHHRWVLLVAMTGEATVRVDRSSRRVGPGTALLIPPLHFHHYHDVSAGRLRWLYITFDWPGQTSPPDGELGPHALSEEALSHLLSLADRWRDGRAAAGTLLSAEVMALLLLLFPTVAAHAPARTKEDGVGELVAAVRSEAAAHPGRLLSLSEMARRMGMSASHLRAEFRAQAGLSLGRYLREWRLREAALLLSSENLSVKETAERLGFRDIYAFSRAFTRALGIPPSSLRTKTGRQD